MVIDRMAIRAKNTILINDFRAGELTPDLDARVDLKDYYRGCKILENAMPIIEGGVARVPGTYYVRPVKTDEGWCLRVTKSGTGTGIVTSDLIPGINCGSDCYVFFVDGITVVLTATADAGSSFVMWSGDGTGAVTRSVFMDGDKVVNAEFIIRTNLDFVPIDMCTDGTYLYIVGYKYYAATGNYVCKAVKRRVSDLGEVDSVEYDSVVNSTIEYYWSIKHEAGFLYIAGIGLATGTTRQIGIVHKRPTSNLGTLTWSYAYDAGGSTHAWFRDIDLDTDYVYAVGDSPPNTSVLKVKLNKSNGSLVWSRNNTISVAFSVNNFGDSLYLGKNWTGLMFLEKVNKINPDTYTEKNYAVSGGLFKGMNDGTSLYLGGIQPSTGDRRGYTQKTLISDLNIIWGLTSNYGSTVNILEQTNKVIKHSDGVIYTSGIVQETPVGIVVIEKLTNDGVLSLSKKFSGWIDSAIVVLGDYVYLACNDQVNYPNVYCVERRLASTLEIG